MPDIMQHYGFVLELVFTRGLDRAGWHACRALQPISARPPWLPCMPKPLWPLLAALRRAASSCRRAPSTMTFPQYLQITAHEATQICYTCWPCKFKNLAVKLCYCAMGAHRRICKA